MNIPGVSFVRVALTAILIAISGVASANPHRWQLNMSPGATETSQQVYQIHMLVFLVCCLIGAIVFAAMIISMIRDRKSKGAVAATWSHNTKAEIIWTVLPILILVGMAVPATRLLINMAYTHESEMTIKVTGYQWKWRYDYVDYHGKDTGVHFLSKLDDSSDRTRQLKSGLDPWSVKIGEENTYLLNVDKPLVLPTGTKIRFVVTADDVIHSWWVPALGWKSDAIPGIINDAWTNIPEPGIYRGQCAELCGQDHGFMPIVIQAISKAEFEKWLTEQQQQTTSPVTTAAPASTAATAATAASATDNG